MKILLDTHIALWALTDTAKLSEEVIHIVEGTEQYKREAVLGI